jgi:hypothetical protein
MSETATTQTTAQLNGTAARIAQMVAERAAAVTAVDLGAKR